MITLTDKQVEVIGKYLDGQISMFGTNEEDMATMTEVIEMAEELEDELEAYEESGDDLIRWFWDKYQAQTEDV